MSDWPLPSAHRFETFVRWSASLVAGIPILTLAMEPGVFDSIAAGTALVLCVVLAAGNIAVVNRAIDGIGDRGRSPRTVVLVLWVLAGVAGGVLLRVLPSPGPGLAAATTVTCAAASVVPSLTARRALALSAAVLVLCVLMGDTGSRLVDAVLMGFVLGTCWLSAWTLRVLRELKAATEATERLRIARDLHDVFGRTLATISVKSALAAELVRRGHAEQAAGEIGEIQRITGDAGTEVRRVVRGEIDTSWDVEAAGARSLLQSAGIACTISGDPVPPSCVAGFGWVVREAVTNVLRHSRATEVRMTTSTAEKEATVTIVNDGVPDGSSPDGTGLRAMAGRIEALGGTVAVSRDAGRFVLAATLPVRAGS
ncbi:sensor histidine kinase [Actinoplanes rectilineatus]|uniref:sensor histidine kinase n=1 Tax=Actinoplanes rectilineatus TaxID=113571 RepID=UPI0005F2A910|nr:histidine kinase [Actinoplanes rectilineatus]